MKTSKQYKILAVDDEAENLNVIVRIAEKMGSQYEVLQEVNPVIAYEIAKAELPDIIITDWEMPGMDGIEFIKKLQADESTSEIPIIMYTGIMTNSEHLEIALDAGAVDFIRKPVDEVEFRARVRSMLQLSDSFQTIRSQMTLLQKQKEVISNEKEKSEKLLLNILPEEIAAELKENGKTFPKRYELVTVLFTDFVGFTHVSENVSPAALVEELDYCFSHFDAIIAKHGIEKIKTIGDAYMCAGGLPTANTTNPIDVVQAALDIQSFMEELMAQRKAQNEPCFELRIGVHTGPLVAGVVGTQKFQYDIWGDTVNTASRMESSGETGKVNISESTYELVKDTFNATHRGKIKAKNKGEINMYFIEGRKES